MLLFIIKYSKYFFHNSYIPALQNCIIYLLFLDTIYYWVHRLTHRIPIVKKTLHLTHHDAYHLLPLDFLNMNMFEYLIYIFIVNIIPLCFIKINVSEYIIVLVLITIHSIYIHSDNKENFILPGFINSKYHTYHHQIGGGNYSIYFSLWDDFMNTRINVPDNVPDNDYKIKKQKTGGKIVNEKEKKRKREKEKREREKEKKRRVKEKKMENT